MSMTHIANKLSVTFAKGKNWKVGDNISHHGTTAVITEINDDYWNPYVKGIHVRSHGRSIPVSKQKEIELRIDLWPWNKDRENTYIIEENTYIIEEIKI